MELLIVIVAILLFVGLIVVPIMTFSQASRISRFEERARELEKRVQQQGLTLKALYERALKDESALNDVFQPLQDGVQEGIQERFQEAAREVVDGEVYYQERALAPEQKQEGILSEGASQAVTLVQAMTAQAAAMDVPVAVTTMRVEPVTNVDVVDVAAQEQMLDSVLMSKTDASQEAHGRQEIAEAAASVAMEEIEPATIDMTTNAELVQAQMVSKLDLAERVDAAQLDKVALDDTKIDRKLDRKQQLGIDKKGSKRSAVPTPTPTVDNTSLLGDLLRKGFNFVVQWFKTGNIPVKVGVVVLFAGVGALLNYANDQGWMTTPMWAKLLMVSGGAVGAFVFAWRKREKHRVFSLSLQGGAIGVLLLTVFAAFRLYHFIPAEVAFGVTVLLVALMGVLAVMQNAMALAVLTVFAGFMAPVWLSSGGGNHVALFGYYAILNAGILGMSWYRPWRFLNLLGFVFTFTIATLWGRDAYRPELFNTTEPFLLLFFVFYLFIPIFYARKYTGALRNKVDAALVFGTPLIAFSLQALLLQNQRYALAGCAFGLGVMYFVLRHLVRGKDYLKEFLPAYWALGMGFTTLAVPLAFSAQHTSCIYALEGAALVWWGGRQARLLSRLSGVALQGLASLAFCFTLSSMLSGGGEWPVANAVFINMVILAGAAFFSAWCYRQQGVMKLEAWLHEHGMARWFMAGSFYVLGLFWWLVAGAREIHVFAAPMNVADFAILFAAVSAWLAAEANRKWPAAWPSLTTMAGLCAPLVLVFWQYDVHGSPLMALGWLAWAGFAVLGTRSIALWRNTGKAGKPNGATITQLVWWPTWTVVAVLALKSFSPLQAWGDDVFYAVLALPVLLVLGLSLWCWRVVRLPLGALFDNGRDHLQALYVVAGLVAWCAAMALPASNAGMGLPWLPVLNPIELLQLGFMYMAWVWLKRQNTQPWLSQGMQTVVFSLMGFALVSVMTLRGVHHWGGVAWNWELLSHALALKCLCMVWSMVVIAVSRHAVRSNLTGLQQCCFVLQAVAAGALMGSGNERFSRWGESWGDWSNTGLNYWALLALSLAGLMNAWWYLHYNKIEQRQNANRALGLYLWGMGWWSCSALFKAEQFVFEYQYAILITFVGITSWLASKVYDHKYNGAYADKLAILPLTVVASMGLGLGLNLLQMNISGMGGHVFASGSIIGWLVFAGLTWWSVAQIGAKGQRLAKIAQLLWWVWLALSASIELRWVNVNFWQLGIDSAWHQAGLALPWLVLLAAAIWRWQLIRQPLGAAFDAWRGGWIKAMLVLGGVIWVGALLLPSNVTPLPWLPIFNPIDLLQLVFIGIVFYELRLSSRRYEQWLSANHQALLLSMMGFAMVSVMTLRGVHHWGDMAWNAHLSTSNLTQTCLSILWSVLGVAAWVWGSRKNQRLVWWAGAILMGIVLLKLLAVDRQNLGNILGIVSFIGYGLLCVVVGYFAPAPPKEMWRDVPEKEDI